MKKKIKTPIIICSINRNHFSLIKNDKISKNFKIYFVNTPTKLKKIIKLKIKYIFFIHWRWKVCDKILINHECICFHMTDLPFGRGGSPLQNLIIRNIKKTKLSAFKMTNELDAGPIYLKTMLELKGSAGEIYTRATQQSLKMISKIINGNLRPRKQTGKPVYFKRRTEDESQITDFSSLNKLYNFIRMLDADGYPNAFIEKQKIKFKFYDAKFNYRKLSAKVDIEFKKK